MYQSNDHQTSPKILWMRIYMKSEVFPHECIKKSILTKLSVGFNNLLYFYFYIEDRHPSRCWVTTTSGHR